MRFWLISPPFIVLISGLTGFLVSRILYASHTPAHTQYLVGLFLFVLMYVYIAGLNAINVRLQPRKTNFIFSPEKYVINLYWVIGVFGFITSIVLVITRGYFGDGAILFNLRYSHTNLKLPDYNIGLMSLFPALLSVYYITKGNKKKALIALALATLSSIAVAERTGLLFKFVAFGYAGMASGHLNYRHAAIFILLFIMLAIGIAFGAGKLGSTGSEYFLLKYLGYGISSFNHWIAGSSPNGCEAKVLGEIIGGIFELLSGKVCDSPAGAPVGQFNVYTYMGAPYSFGGAMAVFLSMAFLGLAYAVIFRAARKVMYFALFAPFLVYPLVMVFYAWQFTLNTFIYLAILAVPLSIQIRINRK